MSLQKRILPRYTPYFMSSKLNPDLEKIKTQDNESERITVMDMLYKYLCASKKESGLTVSDNSGLTHHFDSYEYGVYSCFITGTNTVGLKAGDIVEIGLNNFPNLFKVVEITQSSIYIKVLDEDFRLDPKASHQPNSFLDRRIYSYGFGWKAVAYSPNDYLVVKPNSNKKYYWVFLNPTSQDMTNKDFFFNRKSCDNYYSNNSYWNSLQTFTNGNSLHNSPNVMGLMFPLYDYQTNKSVRENIMLYRSSYANGDIYYNNSYINNYSIYKFTSPYIFPLYATNRNNLKATGDWLIWGDDKFVSICVEMQNGESNGGLGCWETSIGELDCRQGGTTFVTTGINSINSFSYISYTFVKGEISSSSFLSNDYIYTASFTHPNNYKDLSFVSGSNVMPNSTFTGTNSRAHNNSIYSMDVFGVTDDAYKRLSPFKTPHYLYSTNNGNGMTFKYINGDLFALLDNKNSYEDYVAVLPLSFSFR